MSFTIPPRNTLSLPVPLNDLGPDYYDSRINPERKKRNHIRELEALGYKVTLDPAA
ncbi:MAG: hypothetical protein ABI903_13410 [Actinomycetota bacterium]